jgi:hypothetical protein
VAHYPEEHLYNKAPKRPRTKQGMTQTRGVKVQDKMSQPKAGRRVHGLALIKALKGMANTSNAKRNPMGRHKHDGSK